VKGEAARRVETMMMRRDGCGRCVFRAFVAMPMRRGRSSRVTRADGGVAVRCARGRRAWIYGLFDSRVGGRARWARAWIGRVDGTSRGGAIGFWSVLFR